MVTPTPADRIRSLVAELQDLEDRIKGGGGDKKIEKQHSDGKLTAIDAPGSVLTFPYGIDSQGNIVGQYIDSDGMGHGFVLVKH